VSHLFACRLLGQVTVKGKAIPVNIYAVDGGGQVRAPRVSLDRELTLSDGTPGAPVSVRCSLSDLSAAGLRASRLPRPFAVGQVVGLTFDPSETSRPISVNGEIVWSHDGAAGIKFLGLAPGDRRVIEAIAAGQSQPRHQ
jgi:hypothetical protein